MLLAVVFVPSAAAGRISLAPGITYERQLVFTPHGPEVIHVMTAPRPGGLYALRPVLSNDSVQGRETVTSMQRRVSASATVGGTNADLFTWNEGLPSGMFMESGVMKTPPHPKRSTVGITDDGRLLVQRVSMLGTWQGSSQRRPLNGLNQRPGPEGVSLFTPAWGPATPAASGTVEITIDPFPPAAPATDLTGTVTSVKPAGGTPIPPTGAVLVGRGASAGRLASEAPVGQMVTARLILRPAVGRGGRRRRRRPGDRRDRQPVFRALESFTSSQLSLRNPRTAIGQRADGRLILVAVDGRQPGYSTGLTNFELAQTMVRLGAVTASGARRRRLDDDGLRRNAAEQALRPGRRTSRRGRALRLLLRRVRTAGGAAGPFSERRRGRRGPGAELQDREALDGHGEPRRPRSHSAADPDRASASPGTYRLTWSGRTPEGSPETEGRWRWVINAVDDQAQQSRVERVFDLNNTLGYLRVRPSRVVVHKRGGNLRVGFRLAHSALVTVTIETASGARVRTIRQRRRAGQMSIRWDGRYGNGVRAFSGPYVARVQTSNAFGRSELERSFSVRRARR